MTTGQKPSITKYGGRRTASRWLSVIPGLAPGRIIDICASRVSDSRQTLEPCEAIEHLVQDMDRCQVDVSLVPLPERMEDFSRVAARHPGRLFGLIPFDIESPHQGLEQARALWDDRPDLVLGVAMAVKDLDPRHRDLAPLYEFCIERDLPVQIEMASPIPVAVLARTYPRLRVIGRDSEEWRGNAADLFGRFPNLFLQVEGLRLLPLLQSAGSGRLAFGSGRNDRGELYAARIEPLSRLPWGHRRNIGWRTAARIYGRRLFLSRARSAGQPLPR